MKKIFIILLVILGLALGAGLGVLIWWLVQADKLYETIRLESESIGDVNFTAAFTRVQGNGDMFWWFYPTLAVSPTSRPVLLWLHGVTGISPSFLANFAMFGPYDVNLQRRDDTWVNDFNLLLVDAPLGTGFSTSDAQDINEFPGLDENVDHLLMVLQSFYDIHEEYRDSPLYICSQSDGAQFAVSLTIKISESRRISNNFKGIILGSPIISPALVLTKLGFYLEELGYIDDNGRAAIENFSRITNLLVRFNAYEEAFDQFTSLDSFINENAGAVAVNLAHIVEKIVRNPTNRDMFGENKYLQSVFRSDLEINNFMDALRSALGIPDTVKFDGQREAAIQAFRDSYMKPTVDKVEYILENTQLNVNIYNGNLDAVSNTPGQLEWINNLTWSGQREFLNSTRTTLVFNRLIEGYFRESDRLRFYWINVAGQSVPLDNPVGIRRVLRRITN